MVRKPTSMEQSGQGRHAMWPTSPAKARITTAITTLAIIGASRDRAPAALFSEVADMDPPTGIPRNTRDTCAAPCPMKSRDESGKPPSGLGKSADMAAPGPAHECERQRRHSQRRE